MESAGRVRQTRGDPEEAEEPRGERRTRGWYTQMRTRTHTKPSSSLDWLYWFRAVYVTLLHTGLDKRNFFFSNVTTLQYLFDSSDCAPSTRRKSNVKILSVAAFFSHQLLIFYVPCKDILINFWNHCLYFKIFSYCMRASVSFTANWLHNVDVVSMKNLQAYIFN